MLVLRIGVTDNTDANDFDTYFTNIWKFKKKVKLIIDTSQCSQISLEKVMSLKGVLDKHRSNSREYIDHSVILVKSGLVKRILSTALIFIRTERPVSVEKI